MKLIVGLGNPGQKYTYNRHNVGALLIGKLAAECKIKIRLDSTIGSYLGKGKYRNRKIIIARPRCFMNLSGKRVVVLAKRYELNPEQILVVVDDLNLEWGKIRIKPKGSSGGHKGVESIIEALGDSNFARLRLGIGRPKQKKEVSDFVLSDWTKEEKRALDDNLQWAAECCKAWVVWDIEKVMNKFN